MSFVLIVLLSNFLRKEYNVVTRDDNHLIFFFWKLLCISSSILNCTYGVNIDEEKIPLLDVQCVSFILSFLKWLLFPDQIEILYTWYGISLVMSGHLRCLPRFLAYWKLTNLPAPTKMRKFNEEQRKFIVRIFSTQSSATQVRREFLHHYGIKGGRKRSQFTAKDFERVNRHLDITGSVYETPKSRPRMKRTRENAEKLKVMLNFLIFVGAGRFVIFNKPKISVTSQMATYNEWNVVSSIQNFLLVWE